MKDVDISVEKNMLTSAGFGGEIRVPIQKQDSYLGYSALITKKEGELEYQFTVSPEEETEFPAIIAKAHMDPETHIIVKDDGNGLEPAFHFYGDRCIRHLPRWARAWCSQTAPTPAPQHALHGPRLPMHLFHRWLH